jgi:hypothetical protein
MRGSDQGRRLRELVHGPPFALRGCWELRSASAQSLMVQLARHLGFGLAAEKLAKEKRGEWRPSLAGPFVQRGILRRGLLEDLRNWVVLGMEVPCDRPSTRLLPEFGVELGQCEEGVEDPFWENFLTEWCSESKVGNAGALEQSVIFQVLFL